MIRINLLTEAKAAAARKKAPILPTGARLNNLLFIGGIAAGALYLIVMGLILHDRRSDLEEETAKARLEAERLKSIIQEVQGYEEKKASLEAKIKLINDLKTNQKGPVRLMDEISKALPDLVWLSSLEMTGNQVVMRGKTISEPPVATYLENLKRSPFFAEPVFKNLGRDTGTQGIFSWEMTLTFKPEVASVGAAELPVPAPAPASPPAGT